MPMVGIEILSREHVEIDALAVTLLDIATGGIERAAELGSVRWRLNRLLMLHLAKEDQHLYPRLKRSSDKTVAALATRMEAEMGNLAGAFQDYSRRWDVAAAQRDWPGFCAATRQVMEALRERVRREERDLYPRVMVARPSRIAV